MKKLSTEDFKKKIYSKSFENHINTLKRKYRNQKVIFYGAGVFAEVVFDTYDLSDLNIIGIADGKFIVKKENFKSIPALTPYEIEKANPDVIIITTYNYFVIRRYFNSYFPTLNLIKMEHIWPKTFIQKVLLEIWKRI